MTTDRALQIERNLAAVRERIAAAATRASRAACDVTLVAVSKTRAADEVAAAFAAGARHFGENRVTEGAEKIDAVNTLVPPVRPTWHMVGHVQSRKARDVARAFAFVHSVDSVKLARRLDRFARETGRKLPVLLECNISGESTKYGFAAQAWRTDPAQLGVLCSAAEEIAPLPGLSLEGLMTMAPWTDDPEDARPVFAGLRELLEELRGRFPAAPWRHLSMGMTDDFEVAVEEGATIVRVGRAIFGPRPA